MNTRINRIFCFLAILLPMSLSAAQNKLEDKALETMKKATRYMMDEVSVGGGFVWTYLPDFSRQWGEMEAKRTMVWNQSPGTPQMGQILLDAYHATGDEYYYEAAKKVASALIWGQLECGGWNYVFDFAGEASLKDWYATVGKSGWRLEEFQHYYGNATYDDSCTTECAQFLLRIYLEKYDPAFRPALDKAIDFILESQYPCGGWPQRYPLMYDHPFQGRADYSSFVTLNDNVIPEIIDFLLRCYQTLGLQNVKEPIYRAIYLSAILQQGEPYAGWSDQYTVEDLKPAHARSYEPKGISPSTTLRMVRQMMDYYRLTGDTRFLSGIPAALKFVESLRLPDSEAAKFNRRSSNPDAFLVPRFVNPDTGLPHYVHREGSNVFNGRYYTDQNISNTIGHYSSAAWVDLKPYWEQYEAIKAADVAELTKDSPLLSHEQVPLPKYYSVQMRGQGPDEAQVKSIIEALEGEGYWLSPLGNTSNPYKPGADTTPSKETKYVSTNVGDEYDTSPYRADGSQKCISTRDYISKMSTLIRFIDNQ